MIGEKDDDYGYILFSLPERRGEINIILSRGNLYSSKDIENWGPDNNTISISEPVIGPEDLERLLDCIRYQGQEFEDDVFYTIFYNVESSVYAEIVCFITKLQKLIKRDLNASEVKNLIFQLKKDGSI